MVEFGFDLFWYALYKQCSSEVRKLLTHEVTWLCDMVLQVTPRRHYDEKYPHALFHKSYTLQD